MKRFLLPALLLIAGPVFAQAQQPQPPKAMSLQEALQYAVANSETIQKAALEEQAAQYRVKEVRGTGLPQVNGSVQLNSYPSLPTQMLPGELAGQPGTLLPVRFGTTYNTTAGIQLQQLLFSRSFFIGLEAAKSAEDLFRLRTQMTQEEVIYNVGSAYYQLLQTKEQFHTIDANFNRLQQLEKLLDTQRKNDLARKVDVNRITVNKTNLENQRQTLAAAYEQQLNALKFFMGMPMDQPIEVADVPTTIDQVVPTNETAQDVVTQRSEFMLLNKQLHLTGLNIKNIQAGYYPSLSLVGQYSYQAQRNDFTFFNTGAAYPWFNIAMVGLQVNVPIFDGFQRRFKVKQAQIEQKQLNQDLRQLSQNIQMGLDNANLQMQTSLRAIQNQERNVQMAEEVFATTDNLYKEGLSPLTDLLEAEATLRESETNLNTEKLKYKLAQLDYLRARGELLTLTK